MSVNEQEFARKVERIRETYAVSEAVARTALDLANGDVALAKLFVARDPEALHERRGENLKMAHTTRAASNKQHDEKIAKLIEVYNVSDSVANSVLDYAEGNLQNAMDFLAENPIPVVRRRGANAKMARLAAAPAAAAPFFEKQRHNLCGQHALNHILQEPKYVWVENAGLLIGGDNPMNNEVKINLWKFCNNYAEELKRTQGAEMAAGAVSEAIAFLRGAKKRPLATDKDLRGAKAYTTPAALKLAQDGYDRQLDEYKTIVGVITPEDIKSKTDDEIREAIENDVISTWEVDESELCDLNEEGEGTTGMIPAMAFPNLLGLVNMDARILHAGIAGAGPDALLTELYRLLDSELVKPNCIGVALNKGAWHWTAIVKHNGRCAPGTYSYVDSINCDTVNHCGTIAQIKTLPDFAGKQIVGAVFIYKREDSYKSVSVTRSARAGGRRRRSTRRRHR